MDFSSAAGELYGVPPAEFVATRRRLAQQAKEAGDAALARRIGALRRPTLSAWAVNLLSRSASSELEELLDVGAEMRAAWGSGKGVRDLEQRRAGLVGSLVRTAAELAAEAGGALREQAVREVEDTLQAATVDADIAEEVRTGRLVQPRSHSGFVPAGFPLAPPDGGERPAPRRGPERAPAAEEKAARPEPETKPEPAPKPKAARSGAARTGAARTGAGRARRAETLRKRAEEAERRLAEREERADAAERAAEEASAEVGRLRRELDRAVAARDAAARRAERAEQNRARAREAAREARAAAAEARRAAGRDARRG